MTLEEGQIIQLLVGPDGRVFDVTPQQPENNYEKYSAIERQTLIDALKRIAELPCSDTEDGKVPCGACIARATLGIGRTEAVENP